MCLAPALLSGLGTAVGAVSTIQQSRAQASAYESQANAANQNAKISEKQAEIASQNGAQEEKQMRQRGAAMIASQKAGFAASGIDSGAGSALDVTNDTSTQNELDALAIRRSSANQVWNYQTEATNYKNQANAARYAAKNAKTAGTLNAFGTILNGVSSYKSKFGKS